VLASCDARVRWVHTIIALKKRTLLRLASLPQLWHRTGELAASARDS
jgi:hypothetical protein